MSRALHPAEAVEKALAESTADACVVLASVTNTANVRWANNTLTTNGVTTLNDVTVISIIGGREPRAASVSRTGVDETALTELVETSLAEARDTPRADDVATLLGSPAADEFGGDAGELSIDTLRPVSDGLAAAFDAARSRDEGRFGYAEQSVTTVYVGTSAGLRLRDERSDGRLELTGRSTDGSRSAWAGMSAATLAELDVAGLEADVAQRLDWSRRHHDIDAGRYETILPSSAVADLMIEAYWAMGALDAHEGHTVYSQSGGGTRVGDALSQLPVTLYSDPAMSGRESTPFVTAGTSSRLSSVFDNGLPLGRTDWIREGKLNALLQTRHSASVTGLPVTPFIDNLAMVVPGETQSLADIVASTDRGLLLTCLWYIREVDPQSLLMTGLTRDGVFLVEQGEVVGAVTNFRFNESPVGMLRRITAASGTDNAFARELGDYFTRTQMPALRIADFNMSTVSQAS
jgi:predicted Zn-dependent protease